MKLYYAPGACSLAPHIVAREAGLPLTLIKVDTQRHTVGGTDYFSINPKGQVPVLELDDGGRLTEGPVVAQYIADKAQAQSLVPAAGTLARYRVMEWQNYVTSELHKSFTPLFMGLVEGPSKDTAIKVLEKKLDWLDGQLEGRKHLTGEDFTAADAYLFTVLRWAQFVSIDISSRRHLARFMATVGQRPAVQAALHAEGLPALGQ
ncbi:glutathione transferase GstA [Ideonella sp. BN130291]|uniref:glutathione transferase GstA n=1 Tax=Ideonella sp. BN130291 TaxID=3112940 RepID=UPI002E25CAA4|nr:glutathione transferase GstA [Ideonella sp. BN130291]